MVISGIKNYFKNLKHFFTPLGVLLLGFVLGLSVALPIISDALVKAVDEISALLGDTQVDMGHVWSSLGNAVRTLDWSEPFQALGTMFSKAWLTETVQTCFDGVFGVEMAEYTAQYVDVISNVVSAILNAFITLLVIVAVSFVGGFFLLRYLVRKDGIKAPLKKRVFGAVLETVLTIAFILLCLWLFSILKYSIVIFALVALLLYEWVSLLSSYLVYGRKKTPFKEVVTLKNTLKLFLCDLVIYVFVAALVVLSVLLTNVIVGAVIGVTLLEIAFLAIGVNDEMYVLNLIE